ncbi:hypothetical protein PC9H_009753 [Pleurotus ostreatus]|uniref:Nucleoporin nup45 n=1 Tax=Pleurotus ostreatus TaxID=5322 RepID=A0A8H6ZRX2_PLEOS|nr:uncharacterized protein PC9H_009753 [Pleurotus ostreatus]KAF7424446.1 hypothetical protein PC9H_009753 [Pleurotus ostreatus]
MSFATNSSAFGIKPTVPAAGSSLFGAPKPQGSNLFGQPQQQGQPTQPSLFGGFGQQQQQNQQNSQPAATGSLFGQPQQQPAAAGSLFGQPAQQQAPTGGLFGQPQQQQQQQQSGTTGGLFGQPAQQQQPSGGLFGQPAQQQQQQPTSNLFGQPAQQQPNAFGSSLFGANNQTSTQQSNTFGGFGSFGQNSQQQQGQQGQQQQQGGFGASTLQAQPTITAGGFGNTSTLFGQKPQQPHVQQNATPLFTKSTKFNDLPDEIKRTLENIDSHIQGRIQIGKELHRLKLGDEAAKGQELIRSVNKELMNTSSITHSDLLYARDIKAKADQAVQDTIIATRIIDGFKNPQQQGAYLKNHATFPLEFFTRITEQTRERLLWYKATIEQIERKLSSSSSQVQHTPQAISATLQAQHATFIALASKTAALDAELQKIKTLYTQLWRSKTGSMRDPFNDLERSGGDLGFSSLNVK